MIRKGDLATLPNIQYPSDIFPTDRFYKEDLADPLRGTGGGPRSRDPVAARRGRDLRERELACVL